MKRFHLQVVWITVDYHFNGEELGSIFKSGMDKCYAEIRHFCFLREIITEISFTYHSNIEWFWWDKQHHWMNNKSLICSRRNQREYKDSRDSASNPPMSIVSQHSIAARSLDESSHYGYQSRIRAPENSISTLRSLRTTLRDWKH